MGGCHAPILIGCGTKAHNRSLNLYVHRLAYSRCPCTTVNVKSQHTVINRIHILSHRLQNQYQIHLKFRMPASISNIIPLYLTIAFTIDTLLTKYHPLTPWLAMRQNISVPLRIGYIIGIKPVHGPPFYDQQYPKYGRISGISHFVQGFVIVMVSMDPQALKKFNSTIFIAIPRSWIKLPMLLALRYRLAYRSLSTPRFLHLLDPTHGVYRTDRLEEKIAGSRTIQELIR